MYSLHFTALEKKRSSEKNEKTHVSHKKCRKKRVHSSCRFLEPRCILSYLFPHPTFSSKMFNFSPLHAAGNSSLFGRISLTRESNLYAYHY